MSLEKLNLYRSKVKRLKLTTLIVLVAISITPGIALRFFLEHRWKYEFALFSLKHAEVLESVNLKISGTRSDILAMNDKIKEYKVKTEMLVSRQRYLLDFFKSAYISKKFFEILYNSWNKIEDDWVVLGSLNFDLKGFSVEVYEIYTSKPKTTIDLVSKLGASKFNVQSKKIYDISVFDDLMLERVVVKGEPPGVE